MPEFIKNIKIENFKAYTSLNGGHGISLNVPKSNKLGSGLTVFVGENNSGKSTILTALSKLKDSSRFYEVEKNNPALPIKLAIETASGVTTIESSTTNSSAIRQGSITYGQLEIIKDNRTWTSSFGDDGLDQYSYNASNSMSRSEIDSNLARRLANLLRPENSELRNKFDMYFQSIIPDFEAWGISSHSPESGDKIAYRAGGQSIEINTSLGSGLLNLFRLVLGLVGDETILFIDEPEAFLHPLAQINLEKLILESSKKRQIVFTTHSPFMFSNTLQTDTKVYGFKKLDNKIHITDLSTTRVSFPPSWNYVSWKFFSVNSVGLHTELYEKLFAASATGGVKDFNDWLDANTDKKKSNRSSDSSKRDYGKSSWPTEESLPIWIRNYYHHPELNIQGTRAKTVGYYRKKPSLNQLNVSIRFMLRQLGI